MRDIFPGHYRPNAAVFRALWKDATVALDANVLLNLYRYPAPARDDLIAAFRKLSPRIFVPYQAALEYQSGRVGTIASQLKRFDEVRKVLRDSENQLQAELGKLQLRKRHAAINPDKFLDDVKRLFDSFNADLNALEKTQPDIIDEDETRKALDGIIGPAVGPVPEQKDLDLIYAEGKRRYDQRCPPGYDDSRKAKEDEPIYISNGLRIERQYGDLLVWKQILAVATQKHLKHLIFVTDDEKSDWWWKYESRGQKILGPRPELIEEAKRDAGVDVFLRLLYVQFRAVHEVCQRVLRAQS